MFEIQVRGESGQWFRLDEPYKRCAVAIDEAIVLANRYDLHGNIQVVPVEGS